MPIYRRSTTNGNLYIKFSVVFPEKNFLDLDKLKVSLSRRSGNVPVKIFLLNRIKQFICSVVLKLLFVIF
jgi:DnaJ-class molecular chaperone